MRFDLVDLPRWIEILILVAVANSAPWAVGRVLKGRWATPLDCGLRLADGSRALGDHKTWRGVVAGTLACAVAARLMGYDFTLGLVFGLLALFADAATSFMKRRLRLKPGAEVPIVDQLPETLAPIFVLSHPLGVTLLEATAISAAFLLLDLAVVRLRHRGG
jgi:hypothetical protein